MRRIVASAPGKVVLSGEYAVLDGAPAIAMAVNRRAHVSIDASAASSVTSLGLTDSADTRLLDCVCEVLDIDRPDAALTLDTSAFADAATGRKLGIGSSAALAVALVSALLPQDSSSDVVFNYALLAHSRFQDGRGSGVDVATSAVGGLIEFSMGNAPRSLSWPVSLSYVLLWSGVAASTSSKLATFGRQATVASRKALLEVSGVLADLWQRGDADALIAGLRDYVTALLAFDVDHELGIFDAGHDELANDAPANNVIFKPCGAGGGDVGIVLGVDANDVARFAQYAESRGFKKLDVELDATGAAVSGEDS